MYNYAMHDGLLLLLLLLLFTAGNVRQLKRLHVMDTINVTH